jgi:predicted CoA-binding protein
VPILDTDPEIRSLLREARTIAVVGLSPHPSRDSYHIAEYLLDAGYHIFPVNPGIDTILGLPAFRSLLEIGQPIDIVDVFRRPEFVPQIVEEASRAGARALWMQLGVHSPAAVDRAVAAGLQTVVNRCILVEHRRLFP